MTTISSSTTGVTLTSGLNTIASGVTISNSTGGAAATGPASQDVYRLYNYGSIIGGAGQGVDLPSSGNLYNETSGLITGTQAVYMYANNSFNSFQNHAANLHNEGTIAGTEAGVDIVRGHLVSNSASGVISGGVGVEISDPSDYTIYSGATVVNAGTIIGTSGTAVAFTGTLVDVLIVDPGAVFDGTVVAQYNLGNTIDLLSGTIAGTISGIGTSFAGFTTIAVDGTWNIAGYVSGSGTIDISAGSDLVIESGVASRQNIAFGANSGTLEFGDPAGFTSTVYGFQPGNTIVLDTSLTANLAASLGSNNALTVTSNGTQVAQFYVSPNENFSRDTFSATATPDGIAVTAVRNASSQTLSGAYSAGITLTASTTTLTSSANVYAYSGKVVTGYQAAGYGSGSYTLINQGSIIGGRGAADGVYFANGGYVSNAAAGVINSGVAIFGAAGTVINAGTIGEINLQNGGEVINASSGVIYAYHAVNEDSSINASLTNFGTIRADGRGVAVALSGSQVYISNAASGTIIGGPQSGVYGPQGGGLGVTMNATRSETLVNAGTIIRGGWGYAALFGVSGTATARVIVEPTAVFIGAVKGQGPASQIYLELASGASAGTIAGIGSTFIGFGTIQVDAGANWAVSGAITGKGTFDLGAGSDLVINSSDVATSPVVFTGAGATLGLADPSGFAATVSGMQVGDKIDFTSIASSGVTAALNGSNQLILTSGGATLADVQLGTTQSFAGDTFAVASDGRGGTVVTEEALCFCAGTLLATPEGEVPVERLSVGDLVLTAGGAVRPIVWIGVGKVLATRGRRNAATPVIVRKGALADNVPHRDLHVTKGHALHLDGVLIPVEFLVNHRSILWDDRAQEVSLYHIELETHDVLLANGAPAESYRDDGNRWLFRNANTGWNQPAKAVFTPVLTGGKAVDAAWLRLLQRTGPRKGFPLTEYPDLHLLVDGVRLDAVEKTANTYRFNLPAPPATINVVSRAAAPQELGLGRDPRCLGVALARIIARRGTKFQVIRADDQRLTQGFHAFEAETGLRWTDGDAVVPASLFAGFAAPAELVLEVAATTQYIEDGAARIAA